MNEQIQELKFKCPEKKDRNFEKGETKSEPCVGSELQLMTKWTTWIKENHLMLQKQTQENPQWGSTHAFRMLIKIWTGAEILGH